MTQKFISYYDYFSQFTLDKLLHRKLNSTPSEWKTWVESLHEYEVNCVASVLTFDTIIRDKYDRIRLSKINKR